MQTDPKEKYPRLPLERKQRTLSGEHRPKELDFLVGGTITDVGFHPSANEGGLTIDFEKDGKPMRMVFGYTELGMWVYWTGEKIKQ